MNEVAYTPEPLDNPNFISRPPDPGPLKLYATVGWDALYHSPFSGAYRTSELMLEKNPYFNVDGVTLTGEEATKRYGMGGQLHFDEPIKETAASLIAQRKQDENDRDYVIGSGETNTFRKATSIPVGMAASLLDPVNTAAMFVPVVGEAKFAAMVAKYGGSITKARLIKGAYAGLVGTAMVEPFVLLPNMQQQANYDISDSAISLGYGAGLGAFLHAGLGAFGDRLKRWSQNDRNAIFEAAMNNILNDKPVTSPARIAEFVDHVEPHPLDTFEGEGGLIIDPAKVETPGDYARYNEINVKQAELRKQDPTGHAASPEYQELAQEIEDIKNRNSSDPGMPPEVPTEAIPGETIKSAAMQYEGKIYTGDNHADIVHKLVEGDTSFKGEDPLSHPAWEKAVDGFVTDTGRFVSRDEALALAKQAGQLTEQGKPKLTDPALAEHGLDAGDFNQVPASQPTIDQIPKRDPVTGKFLSKTQRLQMLQQQIADQKSRVKLQDQKINEDTKTDVTRLSSEEMRNTTETPKVLTEIQSEIPQLEKEAFPETVSLDDEAKIEAEAERQNFEKELEREIGDPAAREKGVNAGITCMTNNLI